MLKQIIIWILLVCPALLMGQDTLMIQQVGEFPGCEVLSVVGDRILVRLLEEFQDTIFGEPATMYHSYIAMYDITEPENPEELDRFLLTTIGSYLPNDYSWVRQRALLMDSLIIAVRAPYYEGDVGYAIESADLVIFDDNLHTLWSDEINFEQQEYDFDTFTLPQGIAVNDGFLYVGMGIGGIYIYDFTDPTDLELVAHIELICSNFAVDGNELVFIYREPNDDLISGTAYLAVADVSNPSELEIYDEREIDGYLYQNSDNGDIVLRDDFLYLTPFLGNELDVFTYRSGNGLELEATPDIGFFAHYLDINDDKLFVSGNDRSLAIYSLDNPLQPEMLSLTQTSYGDIAVHGNYIYQGSNLLYRLGEGNIQIYRFEVVVVNEDQSPVLSEFTLHPAYPNPFNAQTTISYDITQKGSVKLGIYDLSGREVWEQTNVMQSGSHEVIFNAANLSTGIYIARLESGGMSAQQKLILMK